VKYSIVGTGLVGKTLAGIFARQGMRALIANSRRPESLAEIAAELGPHIIPATVDRALDADIIFFAVGSLHFKEVAAKRPDWAGRIVIDVTNALMLPAEIQESELHGRLSSEVNAERVPRGEACQGLQPATDASADRSSAGFDGPPRCLRCERLRGCQRCAMSLVRTLPPAVTETGRDRIRLVDDHLGYEWPS
jgi:NAD(P)-dependent dehydrogenase (short-subunit alcohol dehydrogenase family)